MLAAAIAAGGNCALQAYEGMPQAAVEQTAVREATVKAGVHCIEIMSTAAEPLNVEIYALTGQMVEQTTVADGTTRIDINPGYYIVRIGRHSTRVIVK